MGFFKCKICGAELNVDFENHTAVCPNCGTEQTVPDLPDSADQVAYERATGFRKNRNYSEALNIYNTLVVSHKEDADLYFNIMLCRYGAEVVFDRRADSSVYRVHNPRFESIFDDADYKKAFACAMGAQKDIFETEARNFEQARESFIKASSAEEPYDVYICCKMDSTQTEPTMDSKYAREVYELLVKGGYHVFFAPETLAGKTSFEPVVFSALNSARFMLLFGTKTEYINDPWVKDEWEKYFEIQSNKKDKGMALCYDSHNEVEIPDKLRNLPSADVSEAGFVSEIVRRIKIAVGEPIKARVQATAYNPSENILERARETMADGDRQKALELCDLAIEKDEKYGDAYFYRHLYKNGFKRIDEYVQKFLDTLVPIEKDRDFKLAYELSSESVKKEIEQIIDTENTTLFEAGVKAYNEYDYARAFELLKYIPEYKNSSLLLDDSGAKLLQYKELVETYDKGFEANRKILDFYQELNKHISKQIKDLHDKKVNLCLAIVCFILSFISVGASITFFVLSFTEGDAMFLLYAFGCGFPITPFLLIPWIILNRRTEDIGMGIPIIFSFIVPCIGHAIMFFVVCAVLKDEGIHVKDIKKLDCEIGENDKQRTETKKHAEELYRSLTELQSTIKAFKIVNSPFISKHINETVESV